MEQLNQSFLLNDVSDISGIENLIIYLANKNNGIKENQLEENVLSNSDSILKEKMTFLKVLNLVEKKHDEIFLIEDFKKKVNSIMENTARKEKQESYVALRKNYLNKIRLELISKLAKISFNLSQNNVYKFHKQAAILLIYRYLSSYKPNTPIRVNENTKNDIVTFFKKINYTATGKTGEEIQLNTKKLRFALNILNYLGLVESYKIQKTSYFYPFFDPYLLYQIINEILNEKYNTFKFKIIDSGFPLSYLIRIIGEEYIPVIKNSNSYNMHLSDAISGSLWILTSRKQISIINYGDHAIVNNKPNYITAVLGEKINWIKRL